MANPHEVFTMTEDRWNWDKYIQQIDLIGLSSTDREKAKDSIAYLRRLLHESFLERAVKEANPIYVWYFANAVPAARQSLIRLAESLKALEHSVNFRSALKDIKRPLRIEEDLKRLTEKLSMVRAAHNFLLSGFEVEFDPAIRVLGKRGRSTQKKPDLRVVDSENGSEIIIEVTRMQASDSQKQGSRTFHAIWRVVMDEGMFRDPEALKDILRPRYIRPYVLIHRSIEEEDLQRIVERIRKLIERVRATGKFHQYIDPGTIEVGIASYDDHHLAKEWAAARGLNENDDVVGPWLDSDEITRVKSTLTREMRQLPSDKPGVVMIEASDNHFFFTYKMTEVAPYLSEELKKYPQLLCAVLFHGFDGGRYKSSITPIGLHSFVQGVRIDGSISQSLIIRNPECSQKLPVSTINKLENCITTP